MENDKIICSECKTENEVGKEFCDECGNFLLESTDENVSTDDIVFEVDGEVAKANVINIKDVSKFNDVVKKVTKSIEEKLENDYLKINKIKIDKKSKAPVIELKDSKGFMSKESKVNGYDKVAEDFNIVFQSLVDELVLILPFLEEVKDKITITGLSLSYDDGNIMTGCVITAQVELDEINCPLNINTPFLKFEDETQRALSFACYTNINRIIEEAKAYMQGKTANEQLKMFG